MTIVFVGNFEPEHSTENDLLWTLRDMGHTVLPCQEDKALTDDILAKSLNADMFLYVHTHGWNTPGSIPLRAVIAELHRIGKPTVAFHLDYWYGLPRAADVGRDAFWKCDYVFTADGDPRSQEWFKSLGINHHWSKPGVVKRDCMIAPARPELRQDVIFVGSSIYHPEWPYRVQLIDWLKREYGDRFTHYGPGGIRNIRGEELNALYSSAKVAVGDTLCLGFDHQNYWSDRAYETRGRGGFLIHPDIVGLDDFVVKYKYGDFDQLKQLIDFYLEDDKERERLRILQHEYVRDHETYHDRMAAIIKQVMNK